MEKKNRKRAERKAPESVVHFFTDQTPSNGRLPELFRPEPQKEALEYHAQACDRPKGLVLEIKTHDQEGETDDDRKTFPPENRCGLMQRFAKSIDGPTGSNEECTPICQP
jgi:hypothetical protein